MQALIYIVLAPSAPTTFDPALLRWVRASFPEVVVFDFDSHSTASLADYAIELIKRSSTAIVVVANNDVPEASIGVAMKVLQFIIREEHTTQLLLHGKHITIEKMGETMKEHRFYQTFEEQFLKEKILALLSQ